MAALFQAVERAYGPVEDASARRLMEGLSRLKANTVLRALRDPSSFPRRALENRERGCRVGGAAGAHAPYGIWCRAIPATCCARYFRAGMIETPIA